MRKDQLLEEILEMSKKELRNHIKEQCEEREIDLGYDKDDLFSMDMEQLLDLIAEQIHPELQAELHSECQLVPGGSMFPNVANEQELNEALEHELYRD